MRVIDASVYVHSFEHIHADVTVFSRPLDFGEGNENVYFVAFGSARPYTQNGKHKEYKEDLRKAHDGAIGFSSRAARIGAYARSGDGEILGYIRVQCLCCRQPWKDFLKYPEYVTQPKSTQLENITLMSKCFQHRDISCGITEFLLFVASLKFGRLQATQEDLKEGLRGVGFQDLPKATLVAAGDTKEAHAARNHTYRGQHGRERGR
ncbi:hypothetical protein MTO96_049653 [Rhipicephalus appendiculatus]